MGGKHGDLSIDEGIETPMYLINLPYKVDDNLNGKFFYDK